MYMRFEVEKGNGHLSELSTYVSIILRTIDNLMNSVLKFYSYIDMLVTYYFIPDHL